MSLDIFGTTTIDKVIFIDEKVGTTTELEKLAFDDITVWEAWLEKTGNLVKMKSNNSPSPFTASGYGWGSDGGTPYMAFDGSLDTYMKSNNPNETGDITSTLYFGQEIRIAQITAWIGYGGPVYDYYIEPNPETGEPGGWHTGNSNWLKLYGIKSDGTQVLLATHANTSWENVNSTKQTHNISDANQKIPFIGLTCHRGGKGGQGWYRLYDIRITKWYQKGN